MRPACRSARRRRAASRRPSTCTVLPRPMSSARQAPRPRRAAKESQRAPTSWYGPQLGAQLLAGQRPRERVGAAQARKRLGEPRSSVDLRPLGDGAFQRRRRVGCPLGSGEEAHGFEQRKTPLCAARCACFQCASTWSSFSRSISTQRPRTSASPCRCARNACHSASLSGSPSRARRTSKSTSASSPSAEGGLSPTVTSTPTRGRFFHQSGMRTTTPAVSEPRHLAQEAQRLGRRPGRGCDRRRPLSTNSLASSLCAAARWTGRSSLSSAALSPWKSRRAWPSGRCCGRASRESRVV